MTLPQVDMYMISDRIVDDMAKGRDPNRVYFDGTPEEQLEQMKRYREKIGNKSDKPKIWRLA